MRSIGSRAIRRLLMLGGLLILPSVVGCQAPPVELTDDATPGSGGATADGPGENSKSKNPMSDVFLGTPIAAAGDDRSAFSGEIVELSAEESLEPSGLPLKYSWMQVTGEPVELLGEATDAVRSFEAPDVDSATPLRFQLLVDNGKAVDFDYVEITVLPAVEEGPAVFFSVELLEVEEEPLEGAIPLTVECVAWTLDGSPLPEATYEWYFDDIKDAGSMQSHSRRRHTFASVGRHTVSLMISLAGAASAPIACVSGESGDTEVAVEVREAVDPSGGMNDECLVDDDCNDGEFCNGEETCVEGRCQPGELPCPGEVCIERTQTCVGCRFDDDCDDGLYCNGVESCGNGTCLPGTPPCGQQQCDEATDSCVNCRVDGDCDDGVFCNGRETCESGQCMSGSQPCSGQICDENENECVECLTSADCAPGEMCDPETATCVALAGPAVGGTIRFQTTAGASPPIGEIELRFTGTGAFAGVNFTTGTDAEGRYSQAVPQGWTGTVSAEDAGRLLLTPPSRSYSSAVSSPQVAQDFEAWKPPIGIPAPSFGIQETHMMYAGATYDFGSGPQAYPDAGNGPYTHYVDNTHPAATDANNPFGTPAKPRNSIPQNLPAGSVVEVHGGPYVYGPGYIPINGQGTAAAPIFIRGIGLPRFDRKVSVYHGAAAETKYFIIDGIDAAKIEILAPASYTVVRNCDVHGVVPGGANGGGVALASYNAAYTCHNIVLLNNKVHDNGDWQAEFDQDVHGFNISARCNTIWVLDNEMYHNSGDGLQINAGSLAGQPTLHHVYVGRNLSWENKQTGMWTKQAVDVIFSQNRVHSHRPIGASPSAWGAGMGYQYGPERVWFIFNEISDCSFGIQSNSTSGLGSGQNSYIIGNLIYDIHHDSNYNYNPNTSWANAAMTLAGVPNKHIINNTIYNCDAGINVVGAASLTIVDNIIAQVTEGDAEHIFLEMVAALNNCGFHHNVFYQNGQPARIRWNNGNYDLTAFQSATGFATDSYTVDPQFVGASSADYHLGATSAAVDSGYNHEVFAEFETRYGESIYFDLDGAHRMKGAGHDIGCFER